MSIKIIGAGMAGLLAGNMLRHRATIYEQQKSLPNNHAALLRFKSDVVGTILGVPFKKVSMIKSVYPYNREPVANAMRYAHKVTGQYRTDRSLPTEPVKEDRYIAPENLIQIMAKPLDIEYGVDGFSFSPSGDGPIISTIPMPALVKILGYNKKIDFEYRPTWVVTATIESCDAYATLYFPEKEQFSYRASITGNKLIVECSNQIDEDPSEIASYYRNAFGIGPGSLSNIKSHKQQYGKLVPIDEETRKEFMHWATDEWNVYSLGRYATWRPGLLLDDLVHDVNKISQWIMKGGKYGLRKDR